jgi:hypothetical protein
MSMESQKSSSSLRVPALSHHALLANPAGADYAVIVGGIHSEDGLVFARVARLDNVIDLGIEPMLCAYLMDKKREQFMCDLVLQARNVSETVDYVGEIHVHKAIVATRCPHLANLVQKEEQGLHRLTIDDCDLSTLEVFIDFLYCGRIELEGEEAVAKFVALAQKWYCETYTDMITSVCSISRKRKLYLNTALELLYQWFDLESLVDNQSTYPDVQIVLGSDLDVIVHAHKFVLCRAPFFLNMFGSGFKEAETGIVEFDTLVS